MVASAFASKLLDFKKEPCQSVIHFKWVLKTRTLSWAVRFQALELCNHAWCNHDKKWQKTIFGIVAKDECFGARALLVNKVVVFCIIKDNIEEAINNSESSHPRFLRWPWPETSETAAPGRV